MWIKPIDNVSLLCRERVGVNTIRRVDGFSCVVESYIEVSSIGVRSCFSNVGQTSILSNKLTIKTFLTSMMKRALFIPLSP